MWGKQETIGKVNVLFQREGDGQKANGTIFFDQLRGVAILECR